jgi:hypothetical protein
MRRRFRNGLIVSIYGKKFPRRDEDTPQRLFQPIIPTRSRSGICAIFWKSLKPEVSAEPPIASAFPTQHLSAIA